jgi:murein L,D-transpeptidase YcbB/YkuD
LRKHNLVVSYNGRPVDASSVDWQQTDIRRYQFVQPPGASNVLGTLKFRFPNKHDVYMHDTSQRDLFNQTRRTYSHGCVRVDNPRRLAELLLERDRGMPASEVGRLLVSGPKDNQIELKAKIPVHITYFTAVAEADGTIKTHTDIYGHDARVTAALNGRPMAIEPSPDLTVASRAPQRQVRPAKQAQSFDFFSGLFGN